MSKSDTVLKKSEKLTRDDLEYMSVDHLYNTGVQLKKRDDLEFAADAFRKALTLDKEHVPSLIGLGTLLRDHPELSVGSEDSLSLLNRVTRHVCCPPEIKKATIAITAVHRMMKAAKQTDEQRKKAMKQADQPSRLSNDGPGPTQDTIG